MKPQASSTHALTRAATLCDHLRAGSGEPGPVVEELKALGESAVPAVAALLREKGAGYAFALRILAGSRDPEALAALREAALDPGARDCDRMEAALVLDGHGDPDGLEVLRRLSRRGTLRAAAYYCLREREGGLADEDLALGPYLDDDEVRPLAVEDLLARGYETGGSLDDPGRRARFREGWRSGLAGGKRPS